MSYPVDFPPFPTPGTRGPRVCASVRFYLALINDLPLEQTRVLSEHLQGCPDCTAEFRLLRHTTYLVALLPESAPSARVDKAILATLADRGGPAHWTHRFEPEKRTDPRIAAFRTPRSTRRRRSGTLALAAVLLLLAVILAGVFLRGLIFPASTTFQLPANLSWNGYVLHYTQARLDAQGQSYQVEVYQYLGTNQMHIESSMPGQFDVVVVTTSSTMLGKDMMHHVAEMGTSVEGWAVDGSLFELASLREDLATHRAIYLGQGTFKGQQVYQMRANNGQVLLLNLRYLPVGVLHSISGPGSGVPVYETCQLMPFAQVSDSMWDMSVPPGFRMGELPGQS
ncbi:MAG: anti-sigma factor family protein [Ktedonobacteraceae bacterium]